jgi:transposase-like protein
MFIINVLVSAKMYIHDLIKVIAKIIQNKVLDIHLKKKENPYGDYKNDNSIQRTDKKIKAILMIYRNMFKKITQIITPK